MKQTNSIGIWGLGVVGKSAAQFFRKAGYAVAVMDKKVLSDTDKQFIHDHQLIYYDQTNLDAFFSHHKLIIPSPGIDLRPYSQYNHAWLAELDVFQTHWKKPIIAITGSIGKTTITHFLSKIIEKSGLRVAMCGNIGNPMLDFIAQQENYDIALLEVSSFQLELCKQFAPDLAIWTNFYPNHLDRHSTIEEYWGAKLQLLKYQAPNQQALVPITFYEKLAQDTLKGSAAYFSLEQPSEEVLQKTPSCYWIHTNTLYHTQHGSKTELISLDTLPQSTFQENWLIICAALHMRALPLNLVAQAQNQLTALEHRMEKVATIDGIDFYNDSKSTTPQSTLAALKQLQGRPIILFLGGLSKGVDRSLLIKQIKGNVQYVICFGKEAELLAGFCRNVQIDYAAFGTLDEAFQACTQIIQPNDQIIFSPAGSSYDLFTNYQERGKCFKQLVVSYKNNSRGSA